jgi:hypothetical protein
MTETTTRRCVICNKPIDIQQFPDGHTWAGGHNAEPIHKGRCCSTCNDMHVIPTRIARIQAGLDPRALFKKGRHQ